MVKNYELYFILNPGLTAAKIDKEIEKIEKILKSDLKAENIKFEKEGIKKLAYPIKKDKSGFYVLTTFEASYEQTPNIQKVEKKLNSQSSVIRYILVDQTEFLIQKSKESLNESAEFSEHREFNKGRGEKKKCITKYLGKRVIDYKDVDYLEQFVSPYAKIFGTDRTGTSAKFQRKIVKAIKRARHMALMPFTNKHEQD